MSYQILKLIKILSIIRKFLLKKFFYGVPMTIIIHICVYIHYCSRGGDHIKFAFSSPVLFIIILLLNEFRSWMYSTFYVSIHFS